MLEGRVRLTINRDKTRTVKLCAPGGSLDFLGYTFRYDRDRHGRGHRYLNLFPSKKSQQRERDKLREMTGPKACCTPAVAVIARVNAQVRGWGAYFGKGYPGKAFQRINGFARDRLYRHLRRRSQRPYRPPEGVSWTDQLYRLGLVPLAVPRPAASR